MLEQNINFSFHKPVFFLCLVMLDGKQIHDTTREFLKRLEINKGHKMTLPQTRANPTLPEDITSEFCCHLYCICGTYITLLKSPCIKHLHFTLPYFSDLTKNFTPGVRKSITNSILHDAEFTAVSSNYESKLAKSFMFPGWNARKLQTPNVIRIQQ